MAFFVVERRVRLGRLTAILFALVLGVGACSSDPDSVLDSAEATEEPSESEEPAEAETEPEVAADVDCEALFRNRGPYSTVAGSFTRSATQAEAETQLALLTVPEMREIVEIYRPYQDLEGEVFGSLREGLDNLTTDIDAYEAGAFAGQTGESYKTVSIVPVLEVLGC